MNNWLRRHWVKGLTGVMLVGCLGAGAVAAKNFFAGDCCKLGAACCKPGAACCHHAKGAQASR
ncbi:MAG: hypothetical protein U0174_19005 [Polyangiaceae bacterium]